MRITNVSVSLSYTHNLGNYSNVRPSATLTAELEPGEDPFACTEKLRAEIRAQADHPSRHRDRPIA